MLSVQDTHRYYVRHRVRFLKDDRNPLDNLSGVLDKHLQLHQTWLLENRVVIGKQSIYVKRLVDRRAGGHGASVPCSRECKLDSIGNEKILNRNIT